MGSYKNKIWRIFFALVARQRIHPAKPAAFISGCFLLLSTALSQERLPPDAYKDSSEMYRQFMLSGDFLDAAINSINAFQGLLRKENYRLKVISFNNPSSKELGFNLEMEIQSRLKPLLDKAKTVNTNKFSDVVSSLVQAAGKTPLAQSSPVNIFPVLSSLVSMVSNLAVHEKKITRQDLDSFINATSRYFLHYQKLNNANIVFDQNIEKLNNKMIELQFDIKEYMLDLIIIVNKHVPRNQLRKLNSEELYLKYLEKPILRDQVRYPLFYLVQYPSDGVKNAKDIANNLQKLFNEYQKIYGENYQQIRNIIIESKSLGRSVNINQIDASLRELEELYNDSRQSDVMALRLNTLFERLKILVSSEQPPGY